MATIIAESQWPNESAKKLAELWLGMGEVPEYLNMIWAGSAGEMGVGNKGLVIWQCDDSKLSEGLFFVKNETVRYNVVPGFGCTVKVWTEPTDALKMLGMG